LIDLRYRLLLIGLLAPMAICAALSAEPIGYVSDAWEAWFLQRIDLETGQWLEGDLPGSGMTGLAFSPSGDLFGVMVPAVVPEPQGHAWLAQIRLMTGEIELLGPIVIDSPGGFEFGLTFDAQGRLWLSTEDGRVFEVDPSSAATEQRLNLARPTHGLAACGTTLFGLTTAGAASQPVQLIEINPDAGTSRVIGSGESSVWMGEGGGLDFSADGRLWAVLHNVSPTPAPFSDFVVEFDPASGQVIQSRHLGEVGRGLAVSPPPQHCASRGVTEVPTLGGGGLMVLVLGLALLAVRKLQT
jgi:hypothetical protein